MTSSWWHTGRKQSEHATLSDMARGIQRQVFKRNCRSHGFSWPPHLWDTETFSQALASVSVIFEGQTIKYRYGHENKVENNFEALIITQNENCTWSTVSKLRPFPNPKFAGNVTSPISALGRWGRRIRSWRSSWAIKPTLSQKYGQVLEMGSAVECLPSMQEVLELIRRWHRMSQVSECTPVISALGK